MRTKVITLRMQITKLGRLIRDISDREAVHLQVIRDLKNEINAVRLSISDVNNMDVSRQCEMNYLRGVNDQNDFVLSVLLCETKKAIEDRLILRKKGPGFPATEISLKDQIFRSRP